MMSAHCRLYVYVELEDYKWVERQCKLHDVSKSQVINMLIKEKSRLNPDKNWDPASIERRIKKLAATK